MTVLELDTAIDGLLAVANTQHGPEALFPLPQGDELRERYDHLTSPETAAAFLRPRVPSPPRGAPSLRELRVLADLRAAVRALAIGDAGESRRRSRPLLSRFRYRLSTEGLVAEDTGWLGFAAGLLPGLLELSRSADRLRMCGNPGCEWVFYDRSRKGHRSFCSTASCGNRSKVRRFRREKGEHEHA